MTDANVETLKQRLTQGDILHLCKHENGNYVVYLKDSAPIVFAEKDRDTVNRILHETGQI